MPSQLTLVEREKISQMYFAKVSKSEIAKALKRDRTTIQREIKRNSCGGSYSAVTAQRMAAARRSTRPLNPKMTRPEIRKRVLDGLTDYWAPEQIAGRMTRDILSPDTRVSRSTIERWIRQDPARRHGEGFLRRRGKRRPKNDRRGQLPATVSISGRPPQVDQRARGGDWEGDTIVSPGKRSGLVSMTDRKSGLLKLGKVKNVQSDTVISRMRQQLKSVPASMRHTLTLDNGKEFAQHVRLERLIPEGIFFAHPGCPWERGANENTNGLIRQFLPKGTNMAAISHQRINEIENLINERPRKRLNFRTPNEVFAEESTRKPLQLR